MNQQTLQQVRLAAGLALVAGLTACATSTTPELDKKFGETTTAVREAQVLNPPGVPVTEQGLGLDGKPAVHAQERYQDSFKSPPRTFEVLGIGGSLNGQ